MSSGGSAVVSSGGVASASFVVGGGVEVVDKHGKMHDTTVGSGGSAFLSSGGSGTSTTLSGGFGAVFGGTADGTTVQKGGTEFTAHSGTASGTSVGSGGAEYASATGALSGTRVDGGFDAVYGGAATSSQVVSGAEYVADGGVASGAVVGSGGIEYVYASGSAYNTTVDRGGAAVASSGGLLSGTALHAGGTETIYSGGVADATVVGSGGTEFVLAGGVDNGTVVSGGGTEAVYSGAVIEGIALQSGGAIDLPDLPFGSGGSAVLNAQTNLLTITEGGSSRQVQLTGINSGFTFQVAPDSGSGTLVTIGGAAQAPGIVRDAGNIATTFTVGSEADLVSALTAIDRTGADAAANTAYTINFGGSITLSADLPAINLAPGDFLSINGAGNTLDGGGQYRGFFDYTGAVAVNDMVIADTTAIGGSGAGGGAGLGGGLFVAAGAAVALDAVTFSDDQAVGGSGGGGLGGGGLGGNGTDAGGGIGRTAAGGFDGDGGGGILRGVAPGGAGIAGVAGEDGGDDGGGGGVDGGGGGGDGGGGDGGGDGGDGGGGDGGGGGGGGDGVIIRNGNAAPLPGAVFTGGAGGFGGGGGGQLNPDGAGGAGGFGGGGGSDLATGGQGGAGGFGGGGGNDAPGGFGGGAGGASGGGGGLGAGGAIFVAQGGAVAIGQGSVDGSVGQGQGAGGGASGAALGGGVFLQGDQTLSLEPAGGQTLTVGGGIADQGGAGGAGSVLVAGQGSVVFAAANSYAGGTTLQSGTLATAAGASLGGGAVTFAGAATLLVEPGSLNNTADGGGIVNAIAGFAHGDTIELAGVPAIYDDPTLTYSSATGELQIPRVAGFEIDYVFQGTYAQDQFQATTDASGDLLLSLACFAAGTRIATERGEIPVQALVPGDRVLTARRRGAPSSPVRWIGHRRLDLRAHPDPAAVRPIRIQAGAFGAARPVRDLWLSPDHAVLVGGALIPVRYLVNGATIAPDGDVDAVTYFHVELARHDVLLADGLPAESFLDTGNRGAFANGGPVVQLHPDFSREVWQARGCAPLVLEGPRLSRARRRLLARASALGHRCTADPGLTAWQGGQPLPMLAEGGVRLLRLCDPRQELRLVSRAWVPARMRADEADTRTLGIAVGRLWLDGREASLDSPALCRGWHMPEPGWRWTDGDAAIAAAGARELAFEIAMTGTYWEAQETRQSSAA